MDNGHHPAQDCQPLLVAGRNQRPEWWHLSPGWVPDDPSTQMAVVSQTPQRSQFSIQPPNLPRVVSNPGSAVKMSRAGKSKTSCLNRSWQLMSDSGCRVSMTSIWVGEHSPGDGRRVRRAWARTTGRHAQAGWAGKWHLCPTLLLHRAPRAAGSFTVVPQTIKAEGDYKDGEGHSEWWATSDRNFSICARACIQQPGR